MSEPRPNKIENFPIMMFAVIMGLSGLVILLNKTVFLFHWPRWPYVVLLWLVTGLFLLFLTLYAIKAVYHFPAVRKEFLNPVRINFFATISISLLLLSIAYYFDLNPVLGILLWYLGVLLHVLLSLVILSTWFRSEYDFKHYNPAWFIPVVGIILIPIVGVEAAPLGISLASYAVGLFFWLVLFAIFIYRIIFHHPLHVKFMPTLFILVAPPSIGLISYARITMNLDLFGLGLYSLALFFALLLLFMWRSFISSRFYISWWAYTFPLDAIAIATLLMYEITRSALYRRLAYLFIGVAAATILWVAFKTGVEALQHRLCTDEE